MFDEQEMLRCQTEQGYSRLVSSALITCQIAPVPSIQLLLIGGYFDKQTVFNNQMFYSRIKKKQKSFDKFCLQNAIAFDRELHVSDQSTFVVFQLVELATLSTYDTDIHVLLKMEDVNSSMTQSRANISSEGNTLVSRYTEQYTFCLMTIILVFISKYRQTN